MDRSERFCKIDLLLRQGKFVPVRRFLKELDLKQLYIRAELVRLSDTALARRLAWPCQVGEDHGELRFPHFSRDRPSRHVIAYMPSLWDRLLILVIDTNVLVSAFLGPGGSSREVIRRSLKMVHRLIVGAALFAEYESALQRRKTSASTNSSRSSPQRRSPSSTPRPGFLRERHAVT